MTAFRNVCLSADCKLVTWWRLPELNWGHMDFQSIALPTELRRLTTTQVFTDSLVLSQAISRDFQITDDVIAKN